MTIKLRWYAHNPRHSSVRVFVGPHPGALASAGVLVLARDEARWFRDALFVGTGASLTGAFLEEGWPPPGGGE